MPKIVDKEERRRELASAALEVFLDQGIEATSISDIASRAEIGKGTLYEYFDSKEDIILGALKAWVDRIAAAGERLLGEIDDPVVLLREFVQGAMKAYLSDPRTVRLSISMTQHVLAKRDFYAQHELASKASRGFRNEIVRILRSGVERRVFQPRIALDAEKIAINLVAYLDGLSLHHMMSEGYFSLEQQIDLHLQDLLQGMLVERPGAADGGSESGGSSR